MPGFELPPRPNSDELVRGEARAARAGEEEDALVSGPNSRAAFEPAADGPVTLAGRVTGADVAGPVEGALEPLLAA